MSSVMNFMSSLFIPAFMKWTLPSLNLDTSIVANRDITQNINNRTANSVDPDVTVHYEPSHLDLHCLQKYLSWSVGILVFVVRLWI